VSVVYLSSVMTAGEVGPADGPAAVSSGPDMSVSISGADVGFEAGLAELRVLRMSATSSASSSESQS
jgi:hypothetical protein